MQAFNGTQLRVQRAACRSRCWRASRSPCARRPGDDPRRSTCASSRRGSSPRRAAGTTTCKDALIEALGEARGNELLPPLRRRVSGRLPRGVRGARGGARHRDDGAARRDAEPLGDEPVPAARGARRACCASSCSTSGAPVTLSDSLPMLEHMGLQGARRAPAPRSRRTGVPPIWMHDFGLPAGARRRRRRGRRRCTRCSRTRSARIFRGEVENDDFNRLVVAARLPAERDRRAARLREVHAPDRLPAVAGVHRGDARRARRHRAPAGRAVQARASIRTRGAGAGARAAEQARAIEAALEQRREPVRGPRAAPVPGADPGDDAHQLLAPRRRGQRAQLPVVQVRPGEGAGPARAEADVRDLRLLDALRGRAPARRHASRAAACAGRTGRRISAPRCWAS